VTFIGPEDSLREPLRGASVIRHVPLIDMHALAQLLRTPFSSATRAATVRSTRPTETLHAGCLCDAGLGMLDLNL